MIVYHGSSLAVPKPDVLHSREDVDFGRGFYTTPFYEQAKNWALRFKKTGGSGIVSSYEFDEKALEERNVLIFPDYNEAWLDFVADCRKLRDASDYEIVQGGVANDRVFNTVELYFDGLISKSEALKRLRYEKPNLQICFRNQEVMETYLAYRGAEAI